jgi:2-keto-4-pentenoate hydratase/2-oxohepta-3-ene-1,7-dioic acid hydratase in catechol pathway
MRLATIKLEGQEVVAVVTAQGVVPLAKVNAKAGKKWATEMLPLIEDGLDDLKAWYKAGGKDIVEAMPAIPKKEAKFGPLYRHPHKIWGIGLNYADHAGDLAEKTPTGRPGSFPKWDNTIIGPGDTIKIPTMSQKTTGESELAVIYGKKCKDVKLEDWESVVAGYTCAIDMTAEDILRINPRYLTQVKNFDTFFSFGPELITPDEVPDVLKLHVSTVHNGQVHATNTVDHMTFVPAFLVSYHSQIATMYPGDVISTGTPRAHQINDGDVMECRIDGFPVLTNPVIDLKVRKA